MWCDVMRCNAMQCDAMWWNVNVNVNLNWYFPVEPSRKSHAFQLILFLQPNRRAPLSHFKNGCIIQTKQLEAATIKSFAHAYHNIYVRLRCCPNVYDNGWRRSASIETSFETHETWLLRSQSFIYRPPSGVYTPSSRQTPPGWIARMPHRGGGCILANSIWCNGM